MSYVRRNPPLHGNEFQIIVKPLSISLASYYLGVSYAAAYLVPAFNNATAIEVIQGIVSIFERKVVHVVDERQFDRSQPRIA